MNLVKWIRKNERVVMTWVVIVIMVAFVGGSAFQQIMMRMGGGKQVIADFGENGKINLLDREAARQALSVLTQLRAKEFLLSLPSPIPRQPSFKGMLLCQLLFPDSQTSPVIAQMLSSAANQAGYDIEQEDVDSFFEELQGSKNYVYWILLKQEARNAGIVISTEQAKAYLKSFIPQLSNNQVDAAQVVNAIMNQSNLTENQIIGTFADLLSIMAYTDLVLSSEDITNDQLRAVVSKSNEKINSEFVTFSANSFVDDQPEPTESELVSHFDKYKAFTTSDFTDDNPYGFSYQLPARVQLEYIAIKMSDIKETIKEPTAEEMESYYQNNLASFTEQKKADPGDSESEMVTRQKTYAEVQQNIQYTLTSKKTSNKADLVMNEAVVLTDPGLTSEELENITSAQMKAKSASFEQAATVLNGRYGVKVYTGKTGYLSVEDLTSDMSLGRLSIDTGNQQKLQLAKAVFAIDEIDIIQLGRFEGKAPKMWENIGPMKDQFGTMAIIVRVVDAKKAQVPESIETAYSTKTVVLGEDEDSEESVFSVKDAVAEDVKLVKAFKTSKKKAAEFLKSAKDIGWDEAVASYNEALKPADPNEPVVGEIDIENLTEMNIVSESDIQKIKKIVDENPAMSMYIKGNLARMLLIKKLYQLYTDSEAKEKEVNTLLEFEPSLSSYAIKSLNTSAATTQDYAKLKSQNAIMLDMASSEALAVIHYNPANIEKRMNFEERQDESEEVDTEGTDDSEE